MFCRFSTCIKIVIILVESFELTHATIEVSLVTRTWPEAADHCLLFGSNNTGDVSIDKINIPRTLSDGVYWIGGIVKSAWFEFHGNCSLNVTGLNGTSLYNSIDSILDCYLKCRDSGNFAIVDQTCYCFLSPPSSGQRGNLQRVFHYFVINRNPSKIKGSIRGDCVAFTNKAEDFHEVLDCKTRLPPLCDGISNSSSSWESAVNNCSGVVLSSFTVNYENIASGGSWWTGIARRSIRQWTEGSNSVALFGCLALNRTGNVTSLQEILCDTTLQSLCIKGSITKEIETKNSNDDMIVAISVTATSVFIVLLIFLSVVLWKIKNNKKSNIVRIPSVHNQNYEGEREDDIIPPVYAELERQNIYSGVSSSNQNGRADHIYDHTKIQSMGRTLVVPGDLYDSVNNVNCDKDYDNLQTI
ncbi:uncharacterized protein LOC134235465 [Saccostrea cucullata]|uniref:uncharacterized protein LOC134235465 n=1 Tax=Saccostrea cuccullata TaxID=36930 RepID=UPI002ED61540